jgi:hypothetical protein
VTTGSRAIAEGRRRSTYFIAIAKPKVKGGAQLTLPGDWVGERMADNDFVNRVREQVTAWRIARYPRITAVTRELLAYWQAPDREKPLFFCQIEALETAIFLADVARMSKLLTFLHGQRVALRRQAEGAAQSPQRKLAQAIPDRRSAPDCLRTLEVKRRHRLKAPGARRATPWRSGHDAVVPQRRRVIPRTSQ